MKNKKSLIGIGLLLLVAAVGVTFAYYTSSDSFVNIFNAGKYKVKVVEEFVSPDNWTPGETVPKTVTAKNEGSVDAAVRISYVEKWETLEGTDITAQVNPNPAIINFSNTNDWILDNGYYYYKFILEPNNTSSSFISGVTLDSSLDSVTCTGEGNERTCEARNSASGAKYKLTLTIETAQADKYKSIWGTDVEIETKQLIVLPTGRTKDTLEVGDEICIVGATTECFNFYGYDGNDVKLLSKYNLKVGISLDTSNGQFVEYTSSDSGYGLQGSDIKGIVIGDAYANGGVTFSTTNYWNNNGSPSSNYPGAYYTGPDTLSNIPVVYDESYDDAPGEYRVNENGEIRADTNPNYSIAYFVKNYKNILESYGVTIADARLMTVAEVVDDSIGCRILDDGYSTFCPTTGNSSFITGTSYWLGNADSSLQVAYVFSGGNFGTYNHYIGDALGVRPVIVISKNDM